MSDDPNLFGITPKAKRPKSAPLPGGQTHRLVMLWVALFSEKFRERPVLTPADTVALKRLAASHGADLVARRLQAYLALDDAYVAGEGYPLRLLPRAWNKLIVREREAPGKVPDAAATSAYLRGLKGGRG